MNIFEVITMFFVLLALIYGVLGKKQLNQFFNIILLHALFYILFITFIKLLKAYNYWFEIPNNNHVYVNINMIVQLLFLLYAAHTILKRTRAKWLIYLTGFVFGLAFCIHIFHHGFGLFYFNGDVIVSIGLSLIYLILLNHFISNSEGTWWCSPEILATFGILIYFAGSVPLLSMKSYLIENHIEWYTILWNSINYGFATLRYLLLTVSFYLIYKESRNIKISV